MDFGLSAVLPTVLGGIAGGKVIDKLVSKPKMPEIQKPAVMPTTDDEAVKAARRRQAAEMQMRSGRASTVLSSDDKLGG